MEVSEQPDPISEPVSASEDVPMQPLERTQPSVAMEPDAGAAGELCVGPQGEPSSSDADRDYCTKCGGGDSLEGNELLICDGLGCTRQYHLQQCLETPLQSVPEGVWLCPTCVNSGNAVDPNSGNAVDPNSTDLGAARDLVTAERVRSRMIHGISDFLARRHLYAPRDVRHPAGRLEQLNVLAGEDPCPPKPDPEALAERRAAAAAAAAQPVATSRASAKMPMRGGVLMGDGDGEEPPSRHNGYCGRSSSGQSAPGRPPPKPRVPPQPGQPLGPRTPFELPPGWTVDVRERGVCGGNTDDGRYTYKVYVSPNGKRFPSLAAVQRYCISTEPASSVDGSSSNMTPTAPPADPAFAADPGLASNPGLNAQSNPDAQYVQFTHDGLIWVECEWCKNWRAEVGKTDADFPGMYTCPEASDPNFRSCDVPFEGGAAYQRVAKFEGLELATSKRGTGFKGVFERTPDEEEEEEERRFFTEYRGRRDLSLSNPRSAPRCARD